MRRHPKLETRLVNATGALIAFNREIDQVWSDFTTGTYQNSPGQGLSNLALKSIGLNTHNGTIDTTQLTASVVSKIGGYAFVKVAKFFLRNFRM